MLLFLSPLQKCDVFKLKSESRVIFIVKVFQRAENMRFPKALQGGKTSILKERKRERKEGRNEGRRKRKGGGSEREEREGKGGREEELEREGRREYGAGRKGRKLEEWI